MEYMGFKVYEKVNSIVVENVTDFNPVHIFECGQCFRWNKQPDGSYTGVVRGKVSNVRYNDGQLEINNASFDDFVNMWFEYFNLGRDYSKIKALLSKDDIMRDAISFGSGIRLLKQDIWEALISFIISANNRIPRIMNIVKSLSGQYGEKIYFDGVCYHSFPEAKELYDSTIEKIGLCRGGFRCKYIHKTSGMIIDKTVDLEELRKIDTSDARKSLVRLPGVGDKVADCTLLYSGTKYDVFPTDVWVKRVMEELYFKRETTFTEIQHFAKEYFGELAGFAQQYLFYYARENKIGV